MISGLFQVINYNHNRISSTTRVLHTTTWDYFTYCLSYRFIRSSKEVKEVIMTDISDIVQEFWRTSNDGAVGVSQSFFAMRRLLEILQECLRVCFFFISVFFTIGVDLADINLQMPNSWYYSDHWNSDDQAKIMILFDGYRKMFDQSLSKSKDLDDMLRFLPGVVMLNDMSMQGMAELYRIKPDLLER